MDSFGIFKLRHVIKSGSADDTNLQETAENKEFYRFFHELFRYFYRCRHYEPRPQLQFTETELVSDL